MIEKNIKNNFPILKRQINNSPLVYLDNSATTQMPSVAIDAISNYYKNSKANVHRGIHTLSEESTALYEGSRKTISQFINCKVNELVFIKNATEGCNLVASAFLPYLLKKGDTVLLSEFEHHSNLIPWLTSSKTYGFNVKKIPFKSDFSIDFDSLKKIDYKFIAINHVSNFLGSINDIYTVCNISASKKAYTFIDAAQSIAHSSIDVKKINCDFLVFSGHKIYGPFGSGGLYIRENLFKKGIPYMTGGGMIEEVSFNKCTFLDFSAKYDAGTPNVADFVSLGESLKFVSSVGKKNIQNHERNVLEYMFSELHKIKGVEIYGPKKLEKRGALISFNLKGVHSHDLASVLDSFGVAIRSGHHCTMPAHKKLHLVSSARASLAMYNFNEDIDKLVFGINKAIKLLT